MTNAKIGSAIAGLSTVTSSQKAEAVERKRVNSSTIRAVGYDPATRMLEIEFSNGSIVRYERVPPEIHRRFMAAASPTSYFRDEIEESYTARRVR